MRLRGSTSIAIVASLWAGVAIAQAPSGGLVPGIQPYSPPPVVAHPAGGAAASAAIIGPTTGHASAAGSPRAGADYVLGSGDKLRISVFGEDNLTGEFNVSGSGQISFPLIGDVRAAGQTVAQVRTTIEVALRNGYLKDPRVSAEVLAFRPYFILGEVARPGEYPYADGITVLNAIATAGGFTYRADRKFIFIKRADGSREQRVRLTSDVMLSPGDTARIAERLF